MADFTEADTIRILVTTDNHVGYNERDPVRGDDSWKTFHEIMCLAKERDVDMVLMAGDLFHENKPSRKSMFHVMQSLRQNCFGNKPCELQMLSDGSEHFAGVFNHVNYEDEDMNVAIPVFSIHGNHDDPSGEGHMAALDILAVSGLINYYGRTPESDNIHIKPVLLQKGQTKLALYGMSNVRDERLFRTFRDGNVKFFQPSTQTGDWFNIMSVHQNHHAYTETSYLPERFLPSFLDLIIWGHEHECKIEPETNAEMGFKVMQPGSSVATSLVKGEAVPKHVSILSVTGNELETEHIRLKTVRPFVVKDLVLKEHKKARELAFKEDPRGELTIILSQYIEELIDEANQSWYEMQGDLDDMEEEETPPKPLVRLRVENTPPEGGTWKFDNPQRFSSRFADRVANANDVIQFHKKRTAVTRGKVRPDEPDDHALRHAVTEKDGIDVEKLVAEFLTAQSLMILPQNTFSDAVGQYVNKDDKHAMEEFLLDSLKAQQEGLMTGNGQDELDEDHDAPAFDDNKIWEILEANRLHLEDTHASGERRIKRKKGTFNPKPKDWDSDMDGHWEDSLMAIRVEESEQRQDGEEDDDDDDDAGSVAAAARPARGRGSRGARGGRTAGGTTRKPAAAPKKAPAKAPARSRKKQQSSDEEGQNDDVVMISDDNEDDSQPLFVSQATSRTQRSASPVKRPAPAAARGARGRGRGGSVAPARGTQSTLNFASPVNGRVSTARGPPARGSAPSRHEPSEDEISDDDDAFEPPPAAQRSARTGRR